MTIDAKNRITKQGLRDLNFYGSRKKLAAAAAAGKTEAEAAALSLADAGEGVAAAPAVVADAGVLGP